MTNHQILSPQRFDPCAFITDAEASAALAEPVRHERWSRDVCLYQTTGVPRALAFVQIVTTQGLRERVRRAARHLDLRHSAAAALDSAVTVFEGWLQLVRHRAELVADLGDRAFHLGSSAVVLHRQTVLVVSVTQLGARPGDLRAASTALVSSALRRIPR
jgi:hypothetical protein